jgi:hypothetical protein
MITIYGVCVCMSVSLFRDISIVDVSIAPQTIYTMCLVSDNGGNLCGNFVKLLRSRGMAWKRSQRANMHMSAGLPQPASGSFSCWRHQKKHEGWYRRAQRVCTEVYNTKLYPILQSSCTLGIYGEIAQQTSCCLGFPCDHMGLVAQLWCNSQGPHVATMTGSNSRLCE